MRTPAGILCVRNWFAMMVWAAATAGCQSIHREFSLSEFITHDFSLLIDSVHVNASYDTIDQKINRRITTRCRLADMTALRTVAVSRYMKYDELRDDDGRDLIAIAEPYVIDFHKNDVSSYYGFEMWGLPQKHRRRQVQTLAISDNLPHMPTGISVARGHAICLVATDIRSREFKVEPTSDWVEIAPGMQFRIDRTEIKHWVGTVNFSTRDEPDNAFPHDAQQIRWFRIEQLNLAGDPIAWNPAIGDRMADGTRVGSFAIRPSSDGPVGSLRVSVVVAFDTVLVPFEFYNVSFK